MSKEIINGDIGLLNGNKDMNDNNNNNNFGNDDMIDINNQNDNNNFGDMDNNNNELFNSNNNNNTMLLENEMEKRFAKINYKTFDVRYIKSKMWDSISHVI